MQSFVRITLAACTLFMFNACSKSNSISNFQTHTYNNNFGLIKDLHADALIRQEFLAMNRPTEIEIPLLTDPELSTELTMDADAFLAEDYIEVPEIITYKYQFDPKFYSYPEWRRMDLQ